MAYVYESIQPGLFNFAVPCLDKTVKMLKGDRITLKYELEGSGYERVLRLVEEIETEDAYDNFCCSTDCKDIREMMSIDLSDVGTDGIDIESIITTSIEEMKTEIQTEIQTEVESLVAGATDIDVGDVYATIEPQVSGDTHYDDGYDFFNDLTYIENSTQSTDDYYSFFYVEVNDTSSAGYLRTISTSDGDKHIRNANGSDSYTFNNEDQNLVKYSKIVLPLEVKDVFEIKFENKDIMELGFDLQSDNKTILIYGDPEGFFLNKRVKVRYLA